MLEFLSKIDSEYHVGCYSFESDKFFLHYFDFLEGKSNLFDLFLNDIVPAVISILCVNLV